ncbi:unnamed protein product, partial [Leptidea sinapis]
MGELHASTGFIEPLPSSSGILFDGLVRYEDIKREYNSISHLISSRNKRSAWFNAIGTAFRHIFGTLDEDDAIKYDQAIEYVQTDEKTLTN